MLPSFSFKRVFSLAGAVASLLGPHSDVSEYFAQSLLRPHEQGKDDNLDAQLVLTPNRAKQNGILLVRGHGSHSSHSSHASHYSGTTSGHASHTSHYSSTGTGGTYVAPTVPRVPEIAPYKPRSLAPPSSGQGVTPSPRPVVPPAQPIPVLSQRVDLTFNNGLRLAGDLVGHTKDSINFRVSGGKVYKVRLVLLTKDSVLDLMKVMLASASTN